MPSAPSLNVSLTPQLERFIIGLLDSGRYQSASEVVRAGLRLLEKFEDDHLPPSATDSSGRTKNPAAGGKTAATANSKSRTRAKPLRPSNRAERQTQSIGR